MGLKEDIVSFLRSDTKISKLNFEMFGRRVYPSAYQKDVADAFDKEIIKVKTKGASPGAGATYDLKFDTFEVAAGFSISMPDSKGFVIHECTHAHLDIQNFGAHAVAEGEAVAYLAEAVFMEAWGYKPISTHAVRVMAHTIAKKVVAGVYHVPPIDVTLLMGEVVKEPHYAGKAHYISNGFARNWISGVLR